MLGLVSNVTRVTRENAAVVKLPGGHGAVGVGGPVELAVHEVDAAGLVAGIAAGGDEHLPFPRVARGVIGTAQPVALVAAIGVVAVAGAGVEGVLRGVVGHRVDMTANDGVSGMAQQFSVVGVLGV